MTNIKIYADFNGVTGCPDETPMTCLFLTGYGTLASLSNHQIRLREGMSLTFYTPGDIEVEGEVFFDKTTPSKFNSLGQWLARFDETEVRNSEEGDEPELMEHLCFNCRLDLTEYLRLIGRQYKESCPSCGTDIMYPLLPPEELA
jgi:hypothetical protein